MEQSRPSESDILSFSQGITLRLWNPKIYYRIQKLPPLDSIQVQSSAVPYSHLISHIPPI